MSYRKKFNVFPSHNVPLLIGMFLSTLALVLTIPVTMIGLSEEQSLYGSASESSDTEKINDNDSRVQYTGSWDYNSGGGGSTVAYKSDYHQSPASMSDATATSSKGTAMLTFTGKKIGATVLTWINRGIADIYVDGQLVSSLDGYYGQIVPKTWTSNELSCGQHTVEVKHTGRTTAPKGGTFVLLDYFTVTGCEGNTTPTPTDQTTPTPTTTGSGETGKINDNNSEITYSGSWVYEKDGGGTSVAYKNDYHQSPADFSQATATSSQGSAKYTFFGKNISVTLLTWINRGIADIYVDGQLVSSLDGYYGQIVPKTWTSNDLTCGNHTIEVKHTGRTSAPKGGTFVLLDYFTVTGCEGNTTPTPTSSQEASSTFSFSPATVNKLSNQEFSTNLVLNTGANEVTAVDLVLNYDSGKVNITSVAKGDPFGQILTAPTIDNVNGKIKAVLGVGAGQSVKGAVVNTLVIKGKAKANSSITVGNASQISALNNSGNVLKNSSPLTINVLTSGKKLGDLNGDGKVNIEDMKLVVNQFGSRSCWMNTDLNNDCKVDIYDFNMAAQYFNAASFK